MKSEPIRIGMAADIDGALAELDSIGQKQAPFATALMLTRLSEGSRDTEKAAVGHFFTLRAPERIKKGIRNTPAKKSDFKAGRCHSEVKEIDTFMALQILSGTKTADPSKKRAGPGDKNVRVAIPNKQWEKARGIRGAGGGVQRRLRPRYFFEMLNQLKTGKEYKGKNKGIGDAGTVNQAFIIRKGAYSAIVARRTEQRFPLLFMWSMVPQAKIKARWPMVEDVQAYVLQHTEAAWNDAWSHAISTAR